jgi:DNA-binding NtrC family response regulator
MKTDVRVVAATNVELMELIKRGKFREDLYYRLLGISIELPPLRERDNDIALMAQHFVSEYCKKNAIAVKKFDPVGMSKLLAHSFPGNIRELKSIVELAIVLSDTDLIHPEHIQIRHGNFLEELLSREVSLKDYNQEIVKHYLKRYNNRVRLAAEKLGIGKSTIYRMLGEAEQEEDEDDDTPRIHEFKN